MSLISLNKLLVSHTYTVSEAIDEYILSETINRFLSSMPIESTLLREFIEKIVVHECSYDENKSRRQEIEIYYSFVGKVDLPE
ncbi:DUF4368 domain-containing protein [uncultured Cloacibacillus sp.]|uniref:DUF4368 domain-containing protein n=1 Tax=uncultured Cloacibacillus sp. TaxID=889794 RepID=UPI0034C6AE9A